MSAFDPQEAEWLGSWTIFFWATWIAWGPYVGAFIARISRGRTIREFIVGVLVGPSLFSMIWFSVFGAAGIQLDNRTDGNLGEAVANDGAAIALLVPRPVPSRPHHLPRRPLPGLYLLRRRRRRGDDSARQHVRRRRPEPEDAHQAHLGRNNGRPGRGPAPGRRRRGRRPQRPHERRHPRRNPIRHTHGPNVTLKTDFREERQAMQELMDLNRRDEARQYAEAASARPAPAAGGTTPGDGIRQQMTAEDSRSPERYST